MPSSGTFSVAVAMIVCDEERSLARAITSVRPHVDRVVVVDTGSTDTTVSIARSHDAVVGGFTWCDDFAAARNAALALADADWNLVLDADEWVTGGARDIEELRHRPPHQVGLAQVESTYSSGERLDTSAELGVRVLPRGVRYVGRVHERADSMLPVWRTDVVIAHDGYEAAQAARKEGRNEQLLRTALEECPDDPFLRYQLGKDFDVRGRWTEAARELLAAGVAGYGASWGHDLLVRSIHVLTRLGRPEEALRLGRDVGTAWPSSPDIPFALGNAWLERAHAEPVHARRHLAEAEACWRRCLSLGDADGLIGSVRGRGGHLAAHNLRLLYETLGDTRRAELLSDVERALQPADA